MDEDTDIFRNGCIGRLGLRADGGDDTLGQHGKVIQVDSWIHCRSRLIFFLQLSSRRSSRKEKEKRERQEKIRLVKFYPTDLRRSCSMRGI